MIRDITIRPKLIHIYLFNEIETIEKHPCCSRSSILDRACEYVMRKISITQIQWDNIAKACEKFEGDPVESIPSNMRLSVEEQSYLTIKENIRAFFGIKRTVDPYAVKLILCYYLAALDDASTKESQTNISCYEDALQILLEDHKKFMGIIEEDGIDRMMKWYQSDIKGEVEEQDSLKYLYSKLKWDEEVYSDGKKHYDVISSYWGPFSCMLAIMSKEKNIVADRFFCNKVWYFFDDDNYLKYWHAVKENGVYKEWKSNYMTKGHYALKVLNRTNNYMEVLKEIVNPQMKEFANICHCVANFFPVPPAYEEGKLSFNQIKGIHSAVRDSLCNMVDLIQSSLDKCTDNAQCMSYKMNREEHFLSRDTVEAWEKWFVDNRSKYLLEDHYYVYKGENDEVRIKGIPMFRNQSLTHPLPNNLEEYQEYQDELLRRIYCRALRAAKIISEK
ncbi:hypothetical protein [Clostridium gasigenes]|uniref:hypothetical protein n=1 Tax=Clostridium gasigenes TaxID=94869 RepID=UPI001C0D1C57|nr:hypothetical protein [Clostridium gasigenes]MBU3107563.1 hypothetical protein [Clostridium gasigenes]